MAAASSSEDEGLSHEQRIWLRWISVCDTLVYTFLLAFAIYIVWRYISQLQSSLSKCMFRCFYAFVILDCLLLITIGVSVIVYPDWTT